MWAPHRHANRKDCKDKIPTELAVPAGWEQDGDGRSGMGWCGVQGNGVVWDRGRGGVGLCDMGWGRAWLPLLDVELGDTRQPHMH